MAGGDIWNTIRSSVDIVDVIGEHLALKKAGRELKCLCPFHDDHKPSMSVVPHKQIFHCFVCGTGGDVFKFVTLYHKMTMAEALHFLAKRCGVTVPELPGRSAARDAEGKTDRERIAEANAWACGFFEKQLRADAGRAGLAYLRQRGLTEETILRWRLGFAPESWEALTTAGLKIGYNNQRLAEAGLVKLRPDSSAYDAFRNRVIFPILDTTGRVTAFGGRVLVEKRDGNGAVVEAKYLNSPETKLFNKSESLYGLHLARQEIIKTRQVIVVEGYMDVIACHQAGIKNVVATLGTALTPEHARLLRRFSETVVLIFDSDDAGRRAADRALQTFVQEPLDVLIAAVPDGKDPCDFCMAQGGAAFARVIAGAADVFTYKWAQLQQQSAAGTSISGRQAAIKQFMEYLGTALAGRELDPIRRGLVINQLAGLLSLPAGEISRLLTEYARAAAGPAHINADDNAPPAMRPRPLRAGSRMRLPKVSALAIAESSVLGALLAQPELYDTIRDEMLVERFQVKRDMAQLIVEYLENSPELGLCSLAEFCSDLAQGPQVGEAIMLQEEVEARGRVAEDLTEGWRFIMEQSAEQIAQQSQSGSISPPSLAEQLEKLRKKQETDGGNIRTLGFRRGSGPTSGL